jgi:sulfotransferase family protein
MPSFLKKIKDYSIYKRKIIRAYLKGEIPKRGPDFFIVGATRSGTTFLHYMLGAHPDIFMPEIKELMYFNHDRIFRPDLKNYLPMFHGYRQEKLIGEVTPNYMEVGTFYDKEDKINFFQPGSVIQRIHECLPGAKIIVSLRDPLTRMISQYTKHRHQGKTSSSLSEEIHDELNGGSSKRRYIYKNRYDIHLKNIFDYFPSSAVKVVIFEEWTKNLDAGMADICQFLDVPALKEWPKLPEKAQNKAGKYKKDKSPGPIEKDFSVDPELQALVSRELSMVYKYVEKLMGRKIPWKA